MIPAQEIIINNQVARLYRDGIRDAYYVTSSGLAYSCSHNKGIIKELRPDKARRYPTLRFNVEENGLKVRYNVPMYRIVYELFIDPDVDWNYTRVGYKDGDTHNFGSSNLTGRANYKSEILLTVHEGCLDHEKEYSKFNEVANHVRWLTKLPVEDCRDATQDAFLKCSTIYGNYQDGVGFIALWHGCAIREAYKHYRRYRLRKVTLEEEWGWGKEEMTIPSGYEWLKVSTLTDHERFWLQFLLKGWRRQDIIEEYPQYGRCPYKVRLKVLYDKLRKEYEEC